MKDGLIPIGRARIIDLHWASLDFWADTKDGDTEQQEIPRVVLT